MSGLMPMLHPRMLHPRSFRFSGYGICRNSVHWAIRERVLPCAISVETPRRHSSSKVTARNGVSHTSKQLKLPLSSAAILFAAAFALLAWQEAEAEGPADGDSTDASKIRLSEVAKHGRTAPTQWVVRGNCVYDITEFIPSHPGGEVILRACGGSIDPYWKIFTIHQKTEVYDVLSQFYIGDLDERDLDELGRPDWALLGYDQQDISDPFQEDPPRDPSLIVHSAKPCNAETPGPRLTDTFLTPIRHFFVRNHLWVPRLHADQHKCTIELPNGEEKTYSIEKLKSFPSLTVTVTLQCAGNRRSHMSASNAGPTSGLQWDIGAIGTADFTGVRLRDVLRDAGFDVDAPVNESTRHIHFSSPGDTYTASVPSPTILSPSSDAILVFEMNGEFLPPDHGGPLRVIVPGIVAARSVKWLGRISFNFEEAWSQWQRRDYKCFGPNVCAVDVGTKEWEAAQSIQETPVQSAVSSIQQTDNGFEVRGYAYSGGGRRIVRVDVSSDGSRSWKQAQFLPDPSKGSRKWSWTLWTFSIPEGMEQGEIVVKATDDSYNTQPESFEAIWNFRGLLATAWHRVNPVKKD